MTAVDILRGAKAEVQTRGFWKGGYVGPNGELCALGAMNVSALGYASAGISEATDELWEAWGLTDFVVKFQDGPDVTVNVWNDDPSRTIEDVLALFDRAIEYQTTGKIGWVTVTNGRPK